MKSMLRNIILAGALITAAGAAFGDSYDDAIAAFMHAGQSASFFSDSYGYAVFPTVAKGGLGIGAAHGRGRVYRDGRYVGDTALTQVSFGFQAGGQAYSEIVFFKDADAFNRFTSGHLIWGARTAGSYHEGPAVFTVAKGGAVYEAAVAGQRFSYKPIRVAAE